MKQTSYVRTEMLPEQAPPLSQVGIIGWMRKNLFNGFLNSLLTLVSLGFVLWLLSGVLPWLFSPTWNGASLADCRGILEDAGREGGACWGVVNERWRQMLYGFYPIDQRWRPNLAFALLFVALIPVLFNMISRRMNWVLLLVALLGGTLAAESSVLIWAVRAVLAIGTIAIGIQLLSTNKGDRADEIAGGAKRLPNPLIFSGLYAFIAPWILWGGSVWLPLLVLAGFVIGYVAFRVVTAAAGSLAGTIAAILAAVIWWLFFVGLISGAISESIGKSRLETIKPELRAEIDSLEARVATLADQRATVEPASQEGRTLARLIARDEGLAQRRKEVLKWVTGMPAAEARVARMTTQVAEARAALPPAIAEAKRPRDLPEDVSDEDRAAFEDLVKTEADLAFRQETIADRYAGIGLVGLETVQSRYFGGLMLSITIGVVAIAASLPLGILLALGRQSDLMIVRSLSVGFIEFIRGVPLITLLFVASTLLNYFMPPGSNFDIILRVLIMVSLFASAYMAEVIRGGLAALPRGQYEAADALGLDYWKAQRLIIMPQALKISIPGIVGTFIGVFKDTTLVSIIGLLDPVGLTKSIQADANWNGIIWELYGFVALLFFVFTFSMSRYSMYLERRLRTDHR